MAIFLPTLCIYRESQKNVCTFVVTTSILAMYVDLASNMDTCVCFQVRDCIGGHVSGCCYHDWSHNSAVL